MISWKKCYKAMEDKQTHKDFRKRSLDLESRPVDKDGKIIKTRKLNLKEVLSHGSVDDIDDDDDADDTNTTHLTVEAIPEVPSLVFSEANFDYEEHESDLELSPVETNVKRKSSLRMRKKLKSDEHESEQEDKHVMFADSCGISLTDVRELKNNEEPPEIPRTVLRYLPNAKKKKFRNLDDSGNPQNRCTIKLLFEQPGVDWRFKDKVLEGYIKLESFVDCEDRLIVSGIVAVSPIINVSKVFVRTTMDRWKSFNDYDCAAMEESQDMALNILGYRRFVFTIPLPQDLSSISPQSPPAVCFSSDDSQFTNYNNNDNNETDDITSNNIIRMEFAVACNSTGENYFWDNNNGNNYCIEINYT